MGRSLIRLFAFLLALGIGLAVARLFLSKPKEITQQPHEPDHPEIVTATPAAGTDDFEPEFRDLPNFEDIDGSDQVGAKLIDVSEAGNNYRADKLPATSGEGWLGLFWKNEQLEFRRTKVKVIEERRPNYGYEGSVTFGFPRTSTPVFLIKDSKRIKEGEITTLDTAVESVSEPATTIKDQLVQGFRKDYVLGERKYTLLVAKGLQRDGGRVNVLVLKSAVQTQVLTFNLFHKDHNTLYDSIGELLWVGDMDLDGKLDLYISNFGFEKGGFGSQLFFSSEADAGNLVKRVAAFETAGC